MQGGDTVWLCLNNAFVSIVRDSAHPGRLLVRARKGEHLKRLFPDKTPEMTPSRDYRFRVSVNKDVVASLIAAKVAAIDYGNFKNSVKEPGLHDMYSTWWCDHNQYQASKTL